MKIFRNLYIFTGEELSSYKKEILSFPCSFHIRLDKTKFKDCKDRNKEKNQGQHNKLVEKTD